MDPFNKADELYERAIASKERAARLFKQMLQARLDGWPTARVTHQFLEAEQEAQRAENEWRAENERCLGYPVSASPA